MAIALSPVALRDVEEVGNGKAVERALQNLFGQREEAALRLLVLAGGSAVDGIGVAEAIERGAVICAIGVRQRQVRGVVPLPEQLLLTVERGGRRGRL